MDLFCNDSTSQGVSVVMTIVSESLLLQSTPELAISTEFLANVLCFVHVVGW